MRREFIETEYFQKCRAALGLTDGDLRSLQETLLCNPASGALMQGVGGARKLRVPLPGRGKSGSARVIYADFPAKERTYLLLAYPKSKQASLTPAQKEQIKYLTQKIRME